MLNNTEPEKEPIELEKLSVSLRSIFALLGASEFMLDCMLLIDFDSIKTSDYALLQFERYHVELLDALKIKLTKEEFKLIDLRARIYASEKDESQLARFRLVGGN